jgi:hypothetical protein
MIGTGKTPIPTSTRVSKRHKRRTIAKDIGMWEYTDKVRDHYLHPRNVERLLREKVSDSIVVELA